MATANLPHILTVEQYLNATYRPDADYVNGEIEERNLSEFDHGDLQLTIGSLLRLKQEEWQIRIVTETRVQVAPNPLSHSRCLRHFASLPRERIVRTPPLLCVEVLSPRDTMKAMRKRVQDFLDMGVSTVWILDPETRIGHTITASTMAGQADGVLSANGTPIELPIAGIFATLDS